MERQSPNFKLGDKFYKVVAIVSCLASVASLIVTIFK